MEEGPWDGLENNGQMELIETEPMNKQTVSVSCFVSTILKGTRRRRRRGN